MNVLLSGVVGSTAYGLAGPDSDVDRLGVYAAPTIQFHGLHPPTDKTSSVVSTDPDVTHHEAGKFARLALGGNPTVLELLFLEQYEVQTDLGLELIWIHDSFLSAKRVRDAYFGYATAQFRRLLDTGLFASKQRARVSKHARHMLRLLDHGYELYTTGTLTLRLADRDRYLTFGEQVAAGDLDVARDALDEAEVRFNDAVTVLPDKPNEAVVEAWLHKVRSAFLVT